MGGGGHTIEGNLNPISSFMFPNGSEVRSNGANCPWAEPSKTVQINHSFLTLDYV